MKLFKNYVSKKELRNRLNIQMENNKMVNNQNIFLAKETIKYQDEIQKNRLEIARLIVLTEDLTGFREQDQECIKALKKEKQSLKTKLTKLEKQSLKTKLTKLEKQIDNPTIIITERGKKDGK